MNCPSVRGAVWSLIYRKKGDMSQAHSTEMYDKSYSSSYWIFPGGQWETTPLLRRVRVPLPVRLWMKAKVKLIFWCLVGNSKSQWENPHSSSLHSYDLSSGLLWWSVAMNLNKKENIRSLTLKKQSIGGEEGVKMQVYDKDLSIWGLSWIVCIVNAQWFPLNASLISKASAGDFWETGSRWKSLLSRMSAEWLPSEAHSLLSVKIAPVWVEAHLRLPHRCSIHLFLLFPLSATSVHTIPFLNMYNFILKQ